MANPRGPSGTRYEPIAQIGRGGMAEVLLALADAGGGVRRLAVLKRTWPELATDPEFVTMFLDEARLSLRLNHANVVQTYEVLAGDGELAIAMEYLDGQPLTRVLNRLLRGRGQLPLRLRILTSVLAGLEYAHTLADLDGTPLGVVHRDVSPQNVFVTYDGQVKLVDFGVAKTLAASHTTRPGTLKGKIAYMAPEQLQLAPLDRRADLFSVGVMMWEMLAARRMWQGMTEVDIVSFLASGRPLPVLPADPALPPGLDAIVARALEPDPDRRHQSAAELEMDLEGVLIGSADSHARNLGKVVAHAFEKERAERQAIIERCVRRTESQAETTLTPLPVVPPAPPDAVEVTLSGLERDGGARASGATPLPAATPTPAAATPPLAAARLPAPAPPVHRYRLRRAATFSGLVAVVGALLVVAGGRHPLAGDRTESPVVGIATVQAAPVRVPSPPVLAPPAHRPVIRTAAVSVPVSDEAPRPHAHRHVVAADDGDEPMPPSIDLDQ
jgi:serine/threonine-protein kinase